jgi:three-Cys-motif partner protein
MHLDKVLREEGYGDRIGNGIYIDHARFQDKADSIIEFIKKKSPKNGRSIFALDQYGYKDVPTHLMRKIFDALPRAEIILTFNVDSLMNFANDGDQMKDLLDGLGIPDIFGGRSVERDQGLRTATGGCSCRARSIADSSRTAAPATSRRSSFAIAVATETTG